MRIIKTHRIPAGNTLIWTPFATFVRDDDGARMARVVAEDRETMHWLIDAVFAGTVAVDFAASSQTPFPWWLWAMLAVFFLGLAHKSACEAILLERLGAREPDGAETVGSSQEIGQAPAETAGV